MMDDRPNDDEVDDRPTDLVMDALYEAWAVIANAHGGDWSQASPEWRAAAERWRDQRFHCLLDRPDPRADRCRQLEALAHQLDEALRLTREYVWPDCHLPPVPGWSWYDAHRAYLAAFPDRGDWLLAPGGPPVSWEATAVDDDTPTAVDAGEEVVHG